jgi:transposase
LTLLPEDASQRRYPVREVCNGVRSIVKTGAHWRLMPHDLPPWPLVYQQRRRWMDAACFEAIVHDLRILLRRAAERPEPPTAAILDARTIPSTPASGARAGDDGHKRRKGSKVPAAVDTLGHLLALLVTPANEQERAQVAELASAVQAVTGAHVALAYVDQGDTGPEPAAAAAVHGIQLAVVKLPEANRGFVLLPRRWVVQRGFAWATRFPRLARDSERLAATLAALPGVRLPLAASLHRLDIESLTASRRKERLTCVARQAEMGRVSVSGW